MLRQQFDKLKNQFPLVQHLHLSLPCPRKELRPNLPTGCQNLICFEQSPPATIQPEPIPGWGSVGDADAGILRVLNPWYSSSKRSNLNISKTTKLLLLKKYSPSRHFSHQAQKPIARILFYWDNFPSKTVIGDLLNLSATVFDSLIHRLINGFKPHHQFVQTPFPDLLPPSLPGSPRNITYKKPGLPTQYPV